jgi:hypothetical protein
MILRSRNKSEYCLFYISDHCLGGPELDEIPVASVDKKDLEGGGFGNSAISSWQLILFVQVNVPPQSNSPCCQWLFYLDHVLTLEQRVGMACH